MQLQHDEGLETTYNTFAKGEYSTASREVLDRKTKPTKLAMESEALSF